MFDEWGDQIANVTYTDANISGPFGTVYSAAAGGNWNSAATWKLNAAGTQAGFVPTGNVNVIVTGNPVTATATARARDLTINPGGRLTVNNAIGLTATGNMVIAADATGTGSFLNNGTLTVTGTTQVQRWVTGNWTAGWPDENTLWHYISSPVSGATISTFLGSLLNHWSEPQQAWVPDTLPLTLPLTPGQGFSLAKQAPDGLVTFQGGTLNNNASYSPAITLTGGGFSGWNLVGNPYPCAINWATLGKSNLLATVYTWNAATKNYIFYNGTTGDLTGGIIPPTQAFFVQATAAPASITIATASRLHNTAPLYKNSVTDLLSLHVQGEGEARDGAFIHFRPDATTGFDNECDAYKLFGTADAPQLYMVSGGQNLSINSLPDIASQPVIPVALKVGLAQTYTLTASDLESFTSGTTIMLEDLKTGNVQNLNSNPVYTFSAAPGEPVNRFNLHFTTVGIDNPAARSETRIYSDGQTVYVSSQSAMTGQVTVFDMLGHEIAKTQLLNQSIGRITLDVPAGFYLVRMTGETGQVTGKVFIR